MVLGSLGWLLFIVECYLLMENYQIKFITKCFEKLGVINNLSFIFSTISLIIGKKIYGEYDIIIMLPIIITVIPFVISVIQILKGSKNEIEAITINLKNNYRELNDEEKEKYKEFNYFKKLMILNYNEKEVLVAFDSFAQTLDDSYSIVIEKHNENNIDFYLCGKVIKNKQYTKKEYIALFFNIYAILVSIYGYALVSRVYLSGNVGEENEYALGFLALPFAYAIFSFGTKRTSYKGNVFSTILYYVFWIFKILLIIELFLIWFI